MCLNWVPEQLDALKEIDDHVDAPCSLDQGRAG